MITLKPFDLNEWTNKTSGVNPEGRQNHAMASVWGTKTTLLFGGWDGTKDLNDTWLYDPVINKWTELNPINHPPKRNQFAMSSIYGMGKVLLYGGSRNHTQPEEIYNDTWLYDIKDNSWTNLTKGANPGRIHQHAIAHVYSTDKVVLFGGSGTINKTWVYDLSENNWTQQFPANNPLGRSRYAMASIFGSDEILIFGGSLNSNDTWVYDLSENNWTQKAYGPPGRRSHAMASIWGTDKILLTGGYTSSPWTYYNDTWLYDYSEDKWTEVNTIPFSDSQFFFVHSMATIWGTDKVILYPVKGPGWFWPNETWAFELFDYPAKGTYTSSPFQFGPNSTLKTLTWQANGSSNTDVKFQIRSAQTKTILDTLQFLGPEGSIDTYYTTSGLNLWSGHAGDRWMQYRAYLETSYDEETPTLRNITLVYNYWPNTSLVAPRNGYITKNNDPIFTWNYTDRDSIEQSAFQIIIGDDYNFNIIDFKSRIINSTDNSSKFSDAFTANNLPDGTWYWQVRTKDNDGDWGHYSKPWKLVIDTIPPTSKVTYPMKNKYYNCVDMINGTANESVNGNGLHEIEISLHRMDDDTYFDGLSWVDSETWLFAEGTFNWTYNSSTITWFSGWEYNIRSRATDVPLNVEIPKPGNTFIYDPDPVTFSKAFPSAGESFNTTKIEVGITITDDLSGVNASSIEYAISKDHGATWEPWEPVSGYENGNTIDVKLDVQFWNSSGNQLKWRASDLAGNGPTESKVYPINIINQSWHPNGSKSSKVYLLSPANNSIIKTSYVDLTWTLENSNINGVIYEVYFDDENPPVNKLGSNLSETSKSIENLSNGQTYYWTVIPKVDNITGTCLSGIWSFIVDIPLPRTILKTPGNNSIITSTLPTLVWSLDYEGTETVTYDVYFGTNKEPPLKHEKLSTNYFAIDNALEDNTTYYWLIIPSVGEYEGFSSEVWSFTVKLKDEQIPEFGIELDLNPNPLEIKPGVVKFVSASVTNLGELNDNFTVVIGDTNNSRITTENYRQDSLEIEPGKNKEFLIMISVEENIKPGFENITITARSKLAEKYNLDVQDSQILTIKILEKDIQKGKERGQPISIFYFSILLLIVIVIILSIIILIILRRRSNDKQIESEIIMESTPLNENIEE
jgi:N-acetylneuraminic acid mutarotase